ncbi:TIGR02147 family protein [Bdellovibrio sp. ZAP7]|uniref:TIGR02147 family protein n=1 Tax=Bdellovibrio sp. ZAP7 TaxID=2231053 RepID=UPI00143CEFC0|nr:TIGR02147 family protein [Bdellovibrio sp. ZAP7]
MSTSKPKPQVMDYVDYRQFLQAWYQYNKERSATFSFGTWTLQCGFKSRSFLQQVSIGKRNLGLDSIAPVLQSLKLSQIDGEYFENLVAYTHATNIRIKEYHFQQMLRLNKNQRGKKVSDVYNFLRNPKTPRVHLLLSLKSLTCTVEYVANTFNLPQKEALEILESIEACGLSYFDDESNSWKATEQDLDIPTELGNVALMAFHHKSLGEAQDALSAPINTRHFGTLLMTLNDNEYTLVKRDLEEFFDALSARYTSKELNGARIFQMNFNIFATSEVLKENTSHSGQKMESFTELPV